MYFPEITTSETIIISIIMYITVKHLGIDRWIWFVFATCGQLDLKKKTVSSFFRLVHASYKLVKL